jgi:Leucine-rich repeat (LRR) protein
MIITIQPDSDDVEFIRTHWLALNLIKSFLQALGISEADRERWDDVLWAEIDTSSTIEFEGMTCYLPDTIKNQQSWKYSTLLYNSGYLLLLNGSPFWATMTNTNAVDDLPSDLINFSCSGWPLNELNQSFNKFNQLRALDLSRSKLLTNITPLENFTQLTWLNFFFCDSLLDITPLTNLTQLNSLNLSSCDSLLDITPLTNLTQLNSLKLSSCDSLLDITPLTNLTQLNSLKLSSCKSLSDITPLTNLTQLNSLDLSSCSSLFDITPLKNLTQLNSLDLPFCDSLSDITPLTNLTQLNSLDLSRCNALPDITPLEKLSQLTSLNLSCCDSLSDITPLTNLTQLNSLNLSSCNSLSDITPLEKLTQLNSLELIGCNSLTDIKPLENLSQLTSLNLSLCESISDITPLEKLTQLNSLELIGCNSLTDIKPLENLSQLTSLDLSFCESISDITPLEKLTQITSLNLSSSDSLSDITPLEKLTELNSLDLSYCRSIWDLNPIEKLKQLVKINLCDCISISNIYPIQFLQQIKKIDIQDCLRLTQVPNFKQLNQLQELNSSIHPTNVADILAHCALSREGWAFINQNADAWTSELESALKDSHPAAFDLATSLAIGFPHISFELSERLCQILQTDPLLDYRPWKHLFLGVFRQMGFNFLQDLANKIAAGSWPRGAIGGLSAIAEQLITLPDGKEWFACWVRASSAHHESNPSFLKPVAAPWCLALHCLGENAFLDQWIARFTDPDDSTALDAVFLEFGNHRLGHNDARGAFRHAMCIRATLVRDGLLADIASYYLEAQQADQAAELLFLLSAEDKRAELSLKLADIPHFLDNRDKLHRLLAACGKDAPAIGKLLAKAGMDGTAFPCDAVDERQRAAQDAAQMASIRTGLDTAYVGKLSDLITQFLKNKAYTP